MMTPVRASVASVAARTAAMLWHRMRIFRLANLSAIMPPQGPSSRDGRNCRATVTPTAVTEPESWSTSQSCAIRCIQMAITAMKWPAAKIRKLGTFSEMKVCFQGSRSATTGSGWVWLSGGAEPAASMTGWETEADEGGGGATGVSSKLRAVWDVLNARLAEEIMEGYGPYNSYCKTQ
ncbi:conserved exported hypothetical protein [Arthrobacter sp. 8AJ]|nr:conserved exported hypothetical protein [Arthrobacter sp. 8AJ]